MSAKEFMKAMALYVPDGAAIMGCQFRGDPNVNGRWASSPVRSMSWFDPLSNIYLTVSAMKQNERGEYRRRKENFVGGLLLMVDDVGTKAPLSIIQPITPTALVETSPQNWQAIYMFNSLIEDAEEFDALIRSFIDKQLLGSDTGMSGINRVFRPPMGVNGKAKYNGWTVQLTEWNPDCRYTTTDLIQAFKLELKPARQRIPQGACSSQLELAEIFIQVRRALKSAGMLKSTAANAAGWWDIQCPWTGNHSGGADNGGSIREPEEENGWHGAFKCHHGHCQDKGWSDLTQWIAEEQSTILDLINKQWSDS